MLFLVLFESVELELLLVLDVTLEEVTSPPHALRIIVNDATKTIDRDPLKFISESFQYEIQIV